MFFVSCSVLYNVVSYNYKGVIPHQLPTSRHSRMEMANGGMLCSGIRVSPSHIESPDFFIQCRKNTSVSKHLKNYPQTNVDSIISCITSLPWANAKPPPRSKRMFQGIFSWTISQLSRGEGASAGAPIKRQKKKADSLFSVIG